MSIYEPLRIYGRLGTPMVHLDRLGYLTSCATSRSVLHVGCGDAPIAESRIQARQLLHQRLAEAASSVVGIDISAETIRLLTDAGISSVYVMDAEKITLQQKFDVVLAGDVVEHLSNPGMFLQHVPELLDDGGELIIAVPHAFSLAAVRRWLLNREDTHKDHCFFFSPKTLAQLCSRFNLLPTRLVYTVQPKGPGESSWYCLFRDNCVRILPSAAPSFIMHFQCRDEVGVDHFFLYR